MTIQLRCQVSSSLLTELEEGALPLGLACKVRLHLLGCPACRALHIDLQALPRLLKEAFRYEEGSPAQLQAALDGAMVRVKQAPGPLPWPATPIPLAARRLLNPSVDLAVGMLAQAHAALAGPRGGLQAPYELPPAVLALLPPEPQWLWGRAWFGVRRALLLPQSQEDRVRLVLVSVRPGATLVSRTRFGSDSLVILSGSLEEGGRTYAPGTWIHNPARTRRRWRAGAAGCTCLIREARPSLLSVLAQLFGRFR